MPVRESVREPRRLIVSAAIVLVLALAGCGSDADDSRSSAPPTSAASTAESATSSAAATPTTTTPTKTAPTTSAAPSTATPAAPTTSRVGTTPAPSRSPSARSLPLGLKTGKATQVITVVADSSSDTRASLQRWRAIGSGWRKVGREIDAYVGSAGIGTAREGSSKTPAGSYTLTQAFGRDADPGTLLPYLRTTPDDYWISSSGSKYNTEQRCGNCGYDNGLNERLHDVTPEYDHAVVIDYNTRNAPGGVQQGRGSAFFLHIEAGEPTAGCVAVPRDDLVTVMDWLKPGDNPRILIGVR